MSEQDLRDRMELSVAPYLNNTPIDPLADLTRGRRRLIRRRAAIGLTGVAAAVVVVIGAAAFAIPSAVPDPASSPSPFPGANQLPYAERDRVAAQLLGTARKYVDPKGLYTSPDPGGMGDVGFDKLERSMAAGVEVDNDWIVGAGTGQLWVSVAQPEEAEKQSSLCGPKRNEGRMPYRCTPGKTPAGRAIVTGVATLDVKAVDGKTHKAVKGYFVRYVRPDGQVVDVGLDGANMTHTTNWLRDVPVADPKVTFQQLIAAATDPAMTLKKK